MQAMSDLQQIRGACALDCPDTCSWIVTVKQGEAVALRGDPHHPYTRGSLCNKVADYLNYARSSERVLYPMRRVGPKGSGEFIRISWDEALETVAARLRNVIETDGAEAIWPYAGTGNLGLIQGIYGAGRRLWNVLGTSRHVVTICTITLLPLSGLLSRVPFTVEGRAIERERVPVAQYRTVSSGYFEAAGIPLKRGRTFSEHDTDRTRAVAVVNEELARHWLDGLEPIGALLLVDDNDGAPDQSRSSGLSGTCSSWLWMEGPRGICISPIRKSTPTTSARQPRTCSGSFEPRAIR